MKRSFAILLASLAIATVHAGSFGGPPPFSNGSPLQTGIDGSYQASARGKNLSGVIKFAISKGIQSFGGNSSLTSDVIQRGSNSWAIFYEGRLYKGLTEADIADSNITGILSASDVTPTAITNLQTSAGITPTIGAGTFPTQALIQGQNLSGFFTAKLSQNSPTGSFKGSGEVEVSLPPFYAYSMNATTMPGTPTATGVTPTVGTYVQDPSTAQAQSFTQSSSQGVPNPSNPAATGYGNLTSAQFKVRGTRNSTSVN